MRVHVWDARHRTGDLGNQRVHLLEDEHVNILNVRCCGREHARDMFNMLIRSFLNIMTWQSR